MSFDDYKEGVKKRRQERLHLLKKKQRLYTPAGSSSSSSVFDKKESPHEVKYSDYLYEAEYTHEPSGYALIVKIICSVLLIAGVYTIMKSDNPTFAGAQDFVHEVLVREYNVQGVMAWYEKKTGELPAFLPKIFSREQTQAPVQPNHDYVVPVSGGKVLAAFGSGQDGITVQTASMVPVEVVKEGWVTFVGQKEGLGLTIVIEHGDGEESWYGHVQNLKVQLHDWVGQGQVIGSTTIQAENGKGKLYFALRKDSVFINPLDVMKFD